MLDDLAFAQAWVEARDRSRPRGEVALRRELALKGIDRETIAAVLAERSEAATDGDPGSGGAGGVSGGGADELAAERLIDKSRASLRRVADPRARRGRAYALLARNGFDPDVCREVSARIAIAESALDD